MDQSAHGIILRTRPLTETSLIVQWLTSDLGRISTVAKGARRQKSPFSGRLDLYYEADFSIQRGRRSELHLLKELKLADTHSRLRTELVWLAQAAYAGQFIELATETETPLPEIFVLFQSYLGALPKHPPNRGMPIAFELKLIQELGLGPNLNLASPATKEMVLRLTEGDWSQCAAMQLSDSAFMELNRLILTALAQITQKIPTSRAKALMR